MGRRLLRQFSDLDLFALAYAVLLTAAWYGHDVVSTYGTSTEGLLFTQGLAPIVLGVLVTVFFVLSIHHIFSTRTKTALESQYMLTMALAVVLFSAIMLFVRALESGATVPLLLLQGVYVAWLVFLIRHVNDDGEHLQQRMLHESAEKVGSALLLAAVAFVLSLVCIFFLEYDWSLTLAFLTTLSVPVVRGVEPVARLFHDATGSHITVWRAVVYILITIVAALGLGWMI